MSIKVNTDLVAQTGNAIEIKNQQIRNYFNDVESAVRKLQANWQGAAADRAMEVYQSLKQGYVENRFLAVKNVSDYLRSDVCVQYENTENQAVSGAQKY